MRFPRSFLNIAICKQLVPVIKVNIPSFLPSSWDWLMFGLTHVGPLLKLVKLVRRVIMVEHRIRRRLSQTYGSRNCPMKSLNYSIISAPCDWSMFVLRQLLVRELLAFKLSSPSQGTMLGKPNKATPITNLSPSPSHLSPTYWLTVKWLICECTLLPIDFTNVS